MESIYVNKWIKQYHNQNVTFNHLFLFYISVAFALSDWMYGAFTFTELIMGVSLLSLFLAGKYRIHSHQFVWLLAPIVIISLHTFYLYSVNSEFVWRVSLIALIKLSYYLFSVVGIYNFIKVQKLEQDFMIWNNLVAVVVIVVGMYIAFSVYMELNSNIEMPYEFLLRFTRIDGHLYRRDIPIVRMKSIFQEPAHFGFYLNSILMVNLLSKHELKIKKTVNIILMFGIVATLSYSSVIILIAILLLKVMISYKQFNYTFKWTPSVLISLLGLSILLFFFRDLIYTTLIHRTMEIITGTETSGYERLVVSWRYINKETYLFGYGFLQSPGMLWNVFAYVFTELGLLVLLVYAVSIGFLMKINVSMAIVFILLNFAKGGYLSSSYWFLILLVIIYASRYGEPLHVLNRKEERLER